MGGANSELYNLNLLATVEEAVSKWLGRDLLNSLAIEPDLVDEADKDLSVRRR